MKATKLDAALECFAALSENEKQAFCRIIFPVPHADNQGSSPISKDDFLSEKLDETQTGRPRCPHCQALEVVKNGKHNGLQRFRCKKCGKSFGWSSSTLLNHSRKSVEQWLDFVGCFMNTFSLRESASICKISLDTAFKWRHKLLDCLQNIHHSIHLSGLVEADETYFQLSFKGRRKKNWTGIDRKPKARGSAASKRGLSKELVCVPCAVNLKGQSTGTVCSLGRPTTNQLDKAISSKLVAGSTLVTDSLRGYGSIAESCHLDHVQIPNGKRKKGIFNIQVINQYHGALKGLVNRRFLGVATKYLNNYIVYNNFVNFAKESKREKRRILETFVLTMPLSPFSFSHEISKRPAVPLL